MKIVYLKEHDVEQLASVPEVIEALDAAFRSQAAGKAWTNPRNRLRLPGATLHMMAGAIPGYFGYKAYTVTAGKTQFFFYLYSAETTELIAIMEADALGQIRTGAATGLATPPLLQAGTRAGAVTVAVDVPAFPSAPLVEYAATVLPGCRLAEPHLDGQLGAVLHQRLRRLGAGRAAQLDRAGGDVGELLDGIAAHRRTARRLMTSSSLPP